MTYIKLEDVQKILENTKQSYADNHWVVRTLNNDINSLPSIDPQEMIKEMIEENRDEVYMEWKETTITKIEYELLQELLNKLS